MSEQIVLGGIVVEVQKKAIKNVHLSVNPPDGNVKISAPQKASLDIIRAYAASKIEWIRQQQRKMATQERETPRDYIERERHYVSGKRYLLEVVEADAPAQVELKHNTIVLRVRPGTSAERRKEILDEFYREEVKVAVPDVIAKWTSTLGVTMPRLFVQRMKTQWGSCCQQTRSIRLNSELAKKPPECLEYVVAHEVSHLLEYTHNRDFFSPRLI